MNIQTKVKSCNDINALTNIIKSLDISNDLETFCAYCTDVPSTLAIYNHDIIIDKAFIHSVMYFLLLPVIIKGESEPKQDNNMVFNFETKIIEMVKKYVSSVISNRGEEEIDSSLLISDELSDTFEIFVFEDTIRKAYDKRITIPLYRQAYYNEKFKSFLNFVFKSNWSDVYDDRFNLAIEAILKMGFEKIHNAIGSSGNYNRKFFKMDESLSKVDKLLLEELDDRYNIFGIIQYNLNEECSRVNSLCRYLKDKACEYTRDSILSTTLYYSEKFNIDADVIHDATLDAYASLSNTKYPSMMIALEMEMKLLSPSNMDKKKEIDKFIDSIVLECRNESVLLSLCKDEPVIESALNLPFVIQESFDITYDEAMEASASGAKKNSVVIQQAQNKIYNAYKTYKNEENKIDSQLTKAISSLKNVVVGDSRKAIIEGKEFSPIGILKKALATVAIFSYSKIALIALLITRFAYKKTTTDNERRKLIMELDTEIELINEKIDDAKGDGNKKAKYALMRTKSELINAQRKIKFGIEADRNSLNKAKSMLSKKGR